MAVRRSMVGIVLGTVLAGTALGGLAAPARASSDPGPAAAVQVVVGANRTTGHGPAGQLASSSQRRTREAVPAADGVEQGTTADDLTMGGQPSWFWVGWLLLAVPAGSVLAWWIGRDRERRGPSTGPLYS